jgi:hypothetical protein
MMPRYDLLMKEGRLPLKTEVPPKEYSRRRVQVKVVHMGLRDTSVWRRWQETTRAWALNMLEECSVEK